jgi:hypothetical protein
MAFELPVLPSFQTNIPQQIAAMPSPLEQYGKMLQLRALSGQIGQQQMQPLQVEQAQQGVQAATLENQQRQLQLDSQKALQKAIAAGELGKFAGIATQDGSGFDGAGAYQHLLTSHPEILPQDAGNLVQSVQTISKNTAEISKDTSQAGEAQMAMRAKTLSAVASKMGSIEDAFKNDPEKAGPAALAAFKQDLIQNPKAYQGMTKDEMGHLYATPPDVDHIKAVEGLLGLEGQVTDWHKSQAEATKAQLGVATPSASQLSTFTTKTIPGFSALRPEQKQAFIAEAQNARTVDELNKVTERADATDRADACRFPRANRSAQGPGIWPEGPRSER